MSFFFFFLGNLPVFGGDLIFFSPRKLSFPPRGHFFFFFPKGGPTFTLECRFFFLEGGLFFLVKKTPF